MTMEASTPAIREYYEHSHRVYSRFAPVYDLAASPIHALRRRVVTAAAPDPNASVLDLATGTGAQAAAFAQRCRSVVGLDLSEAMLRVARRKHPSANLRFVHGDAAALPFDDASFDVTCISFALHEMPATIGDAALREMVRVTKPGGTIVVADYALPTNRLLRPVAYHFIKSYEGDLYSQFVRADLPAALASAGARVQSDTAALGGIARMVIATRSPS